MHFRVMGIPQQQGSKTGFGLPVIIYPGTKLPIAVRSKVVMKDANETKLKPWRAEVKRVAEEAWGDAPLLLGPVRVIVKFVFARPKSHYRTGKNAHILRDDAPVFKISTPDGDKLARAIGDALTGVVYHDDSQVQWGSLDKVYATETYADITIIDLSGGQHARNEREEAPQERTG